MSSRVTRSRARSETPQVTDFFKTTKNTRLRGEKKIIEEAEPQQQSIKKNKEAIKKEKQVKSKTNDVNKDERIEEPVVKLFEKKASRTRARTPSRQAELSTSELTGTPPKKTRDEAVEEQKLPEPILRADNDIVLENPSQQKSAIEELMEASTKQKKTTFRTVSDWQAKIAETGGAATKTIHAQSSKNKARQVEELAEALKSPKKKIIATASPVKSKAARSLFSPKKSVPEYVIPGFNVLKSAEKIREEQDDAYEEYGKQMTAEFLKNSQLREEVKESVKNPIKLPSSYDHLMDTFKCVDKITSILQGQNRSCMAPELFNNVKKNSGRDFSEIQLSQILHVYPEAHKVEMRETKKAFGQGGKFELEIKPNLVDDLQGFLIDRSPVETVDELSLVCPSKKLLSPMKSPRKQIPTVPRLPEIDGRKRLDAARMRDRAYVFRYKLTEIVLSHHASYLEEQGFPEMPKMKRMHPAFRPDKHCPPLPQAKLPEAPQQKSSEHLSMKEALEKYMDVNEVKLPSFVQKAYEDLKSPHKSTTGAAGTVPVSPKKFSELQKEQKTSVLDRIRKKAELQKAANACVDKDLEKRAMRLELLKERYARVVCNRFTTKKVQTMKMDTVVEFLRFSSSNPQSAVDCTDHLKLLCEVAPMYVTETVTLNEKHLRFTDNNLEAIIELIEEDFRRTKELIKEQRNKFMPKVMATLTPRPSKAARSLKFP